MRIKPHPAAWDKQFRSRNRSGMMLEGTVSSAVRTLRLLKASQRSCPVGGGHDLGQEFLREAWCDAWMEG